MRIEPVNTTSSTTDSNTSGLPTYLNYKNPNSDSKSEDTPATNPSSTMADTNPSDKPSSSNENSGAGPNPSVSTDPASGAQPSTKQQVTDKPISEPSADETEKVEESKDETDKGAKKLDASTGPKETTTEAYNAAKVDTFVTTDGPHITDEKTDGRVGPDVPKGAMGRGEGEIDFNDPDYGEGTGEKDTKSTGKEADHLMEEKGIHHDAPGSASPKNETSAGENRNSVDSADKESGGKEKVSLKDKIKAKLHKH